MYDRSVMVTLLVNPIVLLAVVPSMSMLALVSAWAPGLLWCDTFGANGLGARDHDS